MWEQKLGHLRAELNRLKAALSPLKREVAKEQFDQELEENVEAITFKIQVIESQISLGDGTLSKNYPDLKAAESTQKSFLKDVKKVFDLKNLKTSHSDIPITVSYKFACDKYMYICPLPREQRAI